MAERIQGWDLTRDEQMVLEQPDLRQRARTLSGVAELAMYLESSDVAHALRQESDVKKLKQIRKAAALTLELLRTLPSEQEESRRDQTSTEPGLATTILDVETEVVQGVEDEAQEKPSVAIDIDKLLGDRAGEIEDLTVDIKTIAQKVYEMAGSPVTRRNQSGITPDPVDRIQQYLTGASYSEIARGNGSTEASIAQWFIGLKQRIRRGAGEKPAAPAPTASVRPVPRPPASPLHYIPPQKETARAQAEKETVPDTIGQDVHLSNYALLQLAVESPGEVASDKWHFAARERVVAVATEEAGFTPEEAHILCDRLGLGEYRNRHDPSATPEAGAVMQKLGRHYFERSKERLAERGLARENVGLRVLTLATPQGLATLDDVFEKMQRIKNQDYKHDLTRNLSERHLVRGVIEILRSDERIPAK